MQTSAFAALIATLFWGCAPALPHAPPQVGDSGAFAPPTVIELPGVPDDPRDALVLAAGDTVRLKTISVQPLEMSELVVDSAGWLQVPLVGPVAVGGRRIDEAENAVADALHRYDRFAKVILTLTATPGRRASVIGAVEKPGSFSLTGDLRVADAVALAGGSRQVIEDGELTDLADLRAARLIRQGVALPISLGLAMQGNLRHNVRLRAGDLLFVPAMRGSRVTVLGRVGQARTLAFRTGIRLSEALARAGGTTREADNGDVRIVRGPLSQPAVYRASLRDLVGGRAPDVELAPGDVVYVTEHWFATVSEVVGKITPLLAAGALAGTLAR